MATTSLSNRQKMINMMYLVLLAILALNVDRLVLDAFVELRQKLAEAARTAQQANQTQVAAMQQHVQDEMDNLGKKERAGLLDTLAQLQRQHHRMLQLLTYHQAKVELIGAPDSITQEYGRADELEENYQYWMGDEAANGGRGNGEASRLRDSLSTYLKFLKGIIAPTATTDEVQAGGWILSDLPDKTWEQATFEGPVVANLAMIESIKMDLTQRQKEVLDALNQRLGLQGIAPDSLVVVSVPQSRIVPAGLSFQTKLYVGMASTGVLPTFQSNQGSIQATPDGMAQLRIPASASVIPAGQSEGTQRYVARVRIPTLSGEFEELILEEDFIVRKPEVLVTSAAVQQLYRHCANPLQFRVPALGPDFQPQVSATEAVILPVAQSRTKFVIEPRGRKTMLKVASTTQGQTLQLEQLAYRVVEPPAPQVEMAVNGRAYTGTAAVARGSRVQIRLKPDPDFATALPKDARYQINQVEVLVKDGLAPARVVQTLNTSGRDATRPISINLPASAASGDKVFVRIKDIFRINHARRQIPERRIPEITKTMALDIR